SYRIRRKEKRWKPQDRKRSPPGRIVGIVLISLTALGLVYLRFSRGTDSASVPSRARRPAAAPLLAVRDREVQLSSRLRHVRSARSRHKVQSRLIALPVTRIRALGASGRSDLPLRGRS